VTRFQVILFALCVAGMGWLLWRYPKARQPERVRMEHLQLHDGGVTGPYTPPWGGSLP
jgi:hypothetical protein